MAAQGKNDKSIISLGIFLHFQEILKRRKNLKTLPHRSDILVGDLIKMPEINK
jgi:hypothetical protein